MTKVTEADALKHMDLGEQYSNDLFEKMSKPIQSFYIDLPMIQDIYLGTLLAMFGHSKENYDYIFECIPEYNKRLTIEIAKYFPKLNVSDKDILDYMSKEENHTSILAISPVTHIFLELIATYKDMLTVGRKFDTEKVISPIKYIVNTYPLIFNKENKLFLKRRMKYITDDITLGVLSKPNNQINLETYLSADILMIHNMGELVHPKSLVFKSFCKEYKFKDKIVITPFFIHYKQTLNKLDDYTEEQISKSKKINEELMGFNCQFMFHTPIILQD